MTSQHAKLLSSKLQSAIQIVAIHICTVTLVEAFEITGQVSAALWSAVCVRVAWGIPNYCPPCPPPGFPPPLTCSSSPPPPRFIFLHKLLTPLMASWQIRLPMNESKPASTLAKQPVSWHLPAQQSHHMHHHNQLPEENPKS